MPKLRRLSGKEVCQILATQGFVKVRQKGSHVMMQKSEKGTTITVPVPDHNELKIGTLNGIIRQSGVPRSLFEIS
ncbi:MAG: type II toxin-antitoxin system HicA family toxin [Candidatus Vecturithrix sp.]|jgi:predicted RNA binding protein YcfA (HicA-like mRNA interferase family)|nr:type II toxin-antitoxin system HicA family toxin [Candidatus Vecturithrix sp.]